ncbi:MAG: AAA family ATPase [Desulfonatronovibrionaceae bacterium]
MSDIKEIVQAISRVVLGKEQEIKMALTCLFAGGHLLIEDLPGIGKTTLAYALARVLGLEFNRIQFTSDLLPGDILGVGVYDQGSGDFVFHPGPIFTQVLLADEINRATPKTQSALLEAMEEGQVSLEGRTRDLKRPFFVIATQNPQEQSGTFPLPESQMDRFLMRITLGYPDHGSERELLRLGRMKEKTDSLSALLNAEDVLELQNKVQKIKASDSLLAYIQDILDRTRKSEEIMTGLSPRAGLSLLQAARSRAFLEGRDFVLPEDVQQVFFAVAGHRLRDMQARREFGRDRIEEFLRRIAVPV